MVYRDPAIDDMFAAKDAEIKRLREALVAFENQWNACGPNSDFGRHFSRVREIAIKAIAEEHND